MRWTYLSDHKTLNPFTTAETGNIPRQLAATGGLFILAESELFLLVAAFVNLTRVGDCC
jgi:hypothetical protein